MDLDEGRRKLKGEEESLPVTVFSTSMACSHCTVTQKKLIAKAGRACTSFLLETP